MTAPAGVVYGTVPKLWPGSTCVVLASGPSLCAEDVDFCQSRAKVIAVKDAIQLAPWADVLYGSGADASQWWALNGESLRGFPGLRYTLDPTAATYATVLRNAGIDGLELDPSGLKTGGNSTYQAVNLAVHLGATKIVLLGADMGHSPHGPKYFFGNRALVRKSPWGMFIEKFAAVVEPLERAGVSMVNASRETLMTGVPRVALAEALG